MQRKHMSVKTRLIASFGGLLALMLLIITTALLRMSQIDDRLNTLVYQDYPKIVANIDVLDNVRGSMARVFQFTEDTDVARMAEARRRLDGNIDAFNAAIARLGQLTRLPQDQAALARIMAARDDYLALVKRTVALTEEQQRDAASTLAFGATYNALHALANHVRDFNQIEKSVFEASAAASRQAYLSARRDTVLLGVAALALGMLGAAFIVRGLLRQLGGEPDRVADIAARIAGGNLSLDIALAPGDRTSLLYSMKAMRDSLAAIVTEVHAGTEAIATASRQIASGNLDLSGRTEQQASALEQTAASMEQLTSTVKHNGDNARQANRLAVSAADIAVRGGAAVARVVQTMDSINSASRRIADIIGVIDGIAFQTNILALNAAVEAARAGAQGRGFAVVAAEVRNLAQRSAAAASEIKALIGDSVLQVEAGSTLVHQAGATMEEIVASVKRVTDIMADITCASDEQETGIGQINLAINQMDGVTQQNAALVEQAAAGAAALQGQAGNLAQVVGIFQLGRADAAVRAMPAARPPGAGRAGKQQTLLRVVGGGA